MSQIAAKGNQLAPYFQRMEAMQNLAKAGEYAELLDFSLKNWFLDITALREMVEEDHRLHQRFLLRGLETTHSVRLLVYSIPNLELAVESAMCLGQQDHAMRLIKHLKAIDNDHRLVLELTSFCHAVNLILRRLTVEGAVIRSEFRRNQSSHFNAALYSLTKHGVIVSEHIGRTRKISLRCG
jgi:hypothetical protein